MKKSWLIGLSLALILVVGYGLRARHYNDVPLPGQSTDEYSNAWVGLSLIRLGNPVGISGLVGIKFHPTYINPDRIFSSTVPGGALAISYPWFDHPPMMGLLTGTFAYLKGERNFEDVSVTVIRKPMLVLGTITVALVFCLAALWFGPLTGGIAALLYATSPLVVIGSRMVQAENGLVLTWLVSLILLTVANDKHKPNLIRWAAFFAGLAVLFKLSGTVAIISGALLLAKKRKSLVEFLAISVSIALLFVFYGLAIDAKEFIAVFLSNSNRVYGIGLNAVYDLITSTKITSTKYLNDGWPLIGWMGMIYLAAKEKKPSLPILFCCAGYLAVYLLFGSASYGWYRIPFLPFLFIAAGHLIARAVTGRGNLAALIALLIPLGVNLSKLYDVNKFPMLVTVARFGTLGLIMGGLITLIWQKNKRLMSLTKIGIVLLFALAVLSNITYLMKIDLDYWYKVS